ncbi:hypothetical protein ILYODFUR_038934 [Ilyodon furcidens]|uniref:Uncharacterized protein n=1 Tax=Ilyodon furcidens TaxID=33524 RepID=A0ABV0U1A7_9TELE
MAEELWYEHQHPHKLLQMHHREPADGLYHCVVRKLHQSELESPTEVGRGRGHQWQQSPPIQDIYRSRCLRKALSFIRTTPTQQKDFSFRYLLAGSTGACQLAQKDLKTVIIHKLSDC